MSWSQMSATKKRNKAREIVARYFRGEYKSTRDYARDFSKVHTTIDLYELATGKKLE